MSTVNVSRDYSASADEVWRIIGDPVGISSWHPAIASSVATSNGRVCKLADGAEVVEEILDHDEVQRSYRYRILESPLPMTDYVSSISVRVTEGGSEVTWTSDFNPTGDATELEGMIRGIYELGLDALSERF